MRRWFWLLSLCWASLAIAGNTHNLPNESRERQAWFADVFQPHIVSGCLPSMPVSSLTTAALACQAYVRASTGELVYVKQDAQALGPLSGGNATYWLGVHRDTSSTVAGWTRQAATHYLWKTGSSQPATPADTMLVAQVTVAGGIITATLPLKAHGRMGHIEVYSSQFATLNDAVAALSGTGGTIYVECGTHTLSSTLNLGTGGVGVASVRHGITLKGLGMAGYAKDKSCAVIEWAGGAAAMIAVQGPMIGWGLENLYLDGMGVATTEVYVQSGQGGEVRNVTMAGHTFTGIQSTCVPTFGGWSGVTDALKNNWYNVWIWHLPPAISGSAGLSMDSTNITCNNDFNNFFSLTVSIAGVDGWGIRLGAVDHVMFYNTHIIDDAMTRSGVHYAYDNGIFAGWPCAANFYGLSLGEKGMSSGGVPLANNTCNNTIFGLTGGDPGNFIPDLPGVSAVYGDKISQDLMLVAGRSSGSTKPVGDVTIYTTGAFPRNLVPSTDAKANLGSTTQRFKDVYLLGGVRHPERGITTTPNTLTLDDSYVQMAVATNATLNLPTAASAMGRAFTVKNVSANTVTLDPAGAELIEGASTYVFSVSPRCITFISDGSAWQIIATF